MNIYVKEVPDSICFLPISRGLMLRSRAVAVLLIVAAPQHSVDAALFPPLAPPRPDELLSKVAEFVLRAKLRECSEINVSVKDGGGMLFGSVEGVSVQGRGWSSAQRLSCRTLDMQVGKTVIDFSALATQRKIVMQKPSIGAADMTFTAADWGNFLMHPLFTANVAAEIARTAAPAVRFSRTGVRLLPDSVLFPIQWDGTTLNAKLFVSVCPCKTLR